MTRILIIIPYFGRWPFWMPFFLESCRRNPSIDWHFISDCGIPPNCPPNVHVEHSDFSGYCRFVGTRLGIDFTPESPYKLCDLKPALGYMHSELLSDYDFWAFGDIDVIYGDLREYFTDARLCCRDLVSTHLMRVSGHLCFVRNSTRMLKAFMRVPDWNRILSDPVHRGFDEGAFSRLFIRHKNWPGVFRRLMDFSNRWRRHSEFLEAYSTPHGRIPWTDSSFNFPSRWHWNEGRLTNDRNGGRTFPYFHFIHWKGDVWPGKNPDELIYPDDLMTYKGWSISEEGFRNW